MNFAVEIQGLNVWIGKNHILKDINLKIPEKNITAILGPSGSGKTTLLRCINRLIDLIPYSKVVGTLKVLGIDIYKTDPYEVRKRVGMVFQHPNPFPHMSIYENVAIAAKISGVARKKHELDEVVRWALEKAMLWDEVKDILYDSPARLSGGQKQRLCLARALAAKPRILLLDEPTSNIDPHNTLKIEEAIRELVKELKMTVVLVTHIPRQAFRLANYAIILNSGRVLDSGHASKVLSRWDLLE